MKRNRNEIEFLKWLELMEEHCRVQLKTDLKTKWWVGAIQAEAKIKVYEAMQERFKEIVMGKQPKVKK